MYVRTPEHRAWIDKLACRPWRRPDFLGFGVGARGISRERADENDGLHKESGERRLKALYKTQHLRHEGKELGSFSLTHWLVVLAIILILFGAGKLPRVMGDFAKGIKNFKAGMKDDDELASAQAKIKDASEPTDDKV